MIVTITFNIPEEDAELHDALRASSYKAALEEFRNYLRGCRKHMDVPPSISEIEAHFREVTYDLLD